ncbi:DUF1648 domain-containing protein [Paenibacillus segetis]|uniref:Membrane protein n=1 Tax=Paenibacillus segetis TaxID=1325360 RepID=A0ABQ1YU21_9BACL|nr:DUF5808 domain-containing protein [Paenibacillus segetis]GGH38512.1 membrane protein [Paenibacillus segetis]
MQIVSAFILILLFAPISIMLAFMPYLTRETVSFGVSVSEEHYRSDLLRGMRKTFASISCIIYGILFIIGLIGLLNTTGELGQGITLGVCIIGMILVSTILNLIFYFKMKQLKPSLPPGPTNKTFIAVDTNFRRQKLAVSNKWFLIHFAITVICAIFVFANYDRIPDTIAMKFDFQGNVVRTAAKSMWTVLFPSIMQLIMILMFLLINRSISSSKQQVHAANPEQSVRQNIIFRRRWSMFTLISSFAMIILFTLIQFNMMYPQSIEIIMFVSVLIPIFIVLFALVLSITTGQGGSRIGRSKVGSPIQPVNDDAYWKLGVVYFNPQDPAIWVEKRSGIGWTVNFANPKGWLMLIGIIVIIVAVSFYKG